MDAPHFVQMIALGLMIGSPHTVQNFVALRGSAPHFGHAFAAVLSSAPQLPQISLSSGMNVNLTVNIHGSLINILSCKG
jgi:hypothetical protein